jgi:hypothetical protein
MTVVLKDRFMENSSDRWIFATNELGELLDIVQFQPRDKIVELKTTGEFLRIDMTIISYDKPHNHFAVETFKDFPPNESIELGLPADKIIEQAGVANVKVTNYNETQAPYLNINFATAAFGTNSITSPAVSGSDFSAYVNLASISETVHVYGLRSGIGVYKTLTNVVPNESRVSDFATFEPFENFVALPYYGSAYTVGIMEDNSQFTLVLTSRQPTFAPRNLYIGTVPGFAKYETHIHALSAFEYWKIGTPIPSFTTPSYTTSIQNNTIENFEVTISGTHDYKSAEFQTSTGTLEATWTVYSPNTIPLNIIFEIPGELRNAYPGLVLDQMKYTSSTFYRSSGTFSYSDMLAYRFKKVLKGEFELFTLPTK